jgi:hypothetical protein
MISKLSLEDCWTGKTPALIVALRGDPDLYHEALHVFYNTNTFAFSKRNDWLCEVRRETFIPTTSLILQMTGNWLFGGTSSNALKTIKKASIRWPDIGRPSSQSPNVIRTAARIFGICSYLILYQCKISHLSITIEKCLELTLCLLNPLIVQSVHLTRFRVSFSQNILFSNPILSNACLEMMDRRFEGEGKVLSVTTETPLTWQWIAVGEKRLKYIVESKSSDWFYRKLDLERGLFRVEVQRLRALGFTRRDYLRGMTIDSKNDNAQIESLFEDLFGEDEKEQQG